MLFRRATEAIRTTPGDLLLKQLGVRARPLKVQIAIGYPVDKQPIRFNVALSVISPIADEPVIFISRIKRFFLHKHFNNRLQFGQIFVLLSDSFKIPLKPSCIKNPDCYRFRGAG
jgi:hypothetical protein